MVILNKIYTKTGDAGTTALGNGERRDKFDLRVSAYGTVDEANSAIGVARLHTCDIYPVLDDMLGHIQNDCFDLGADLCTPDKGEKLDYEPLRIIDTQVTRLEHDIDTLNVDLQPLRTFVLPGGCAASAHPHMARTVARRAERLVVELAQQPDERISPCCIQYLNRLSDFLFVAARWVNDKGQADVLWVPGKNR
ncbi:MAG: cob(I)yrinic acid a,c-diamide adenosyltransferase [Rhizobiales bacterium]|nr:cob(I)yrinic acid a,c-diamide adenosyltransferase [Hyphomicrobiales bacterium]